MYDTKQEFEGFTIRFNLPKQEPFPTAEILVGVLFYVVNSYHFHDYKFEIKIISNFVKMGVFIQVYSSTVFSTEEESILYKKLETYGVETDERFDMWKFDDMALVFDKDADVRDDPRGLFTNLLAMIFLYNLSYEGSMLFGYGSGDLYHGIAYIHDQEITVIEFGDNESDLVGSKYKITEKNVKESGLLRDDEQYTSF